MKSKMPVRGVILLLSGMSLTCEAEQVNLLTVNTRDNQQIHYQVALKPHSYFTDEAVVIRFENAPQAEQEISFPMENFQSLSYRSAVISSTESVRATDATFSITPDEIIASGLPESSSMILCNTAGHVAAEAKVSASGTCSIGITDLPAGTYIVSTATITYKFLKR